MYRTFLFTAFLLLSAIQSRSQDTHFSQYYAAPVFTNPASTGFFEGKYRIGMNYRNQWNAVTTPFTTFLAGIDLPLTRKRSGKNVFGAGFYIMRDKAGDGGYGTTQAAFSGAYSLSLETRRSHYLSLGVSFAPAEKSVDFDKLRFPGQYDGTQYNAGIVHGEQYGKSQGFFTDFSAGLLWSLAEEKGISYAGGFSLFHINQPNISLLDDQQIPLHIRWMLTGTATIPVNSVWGLRPSVMYNRQGKHREMMVGLTARKEHLAIPGLSTTLYGGLFTRVGDAAIILIGMEYDYLNLGISYDINYSGLRKASYLRGGLELSLQYTFQKPQGILKREVTCPIF